MNRHRRLGFTITESLVVIAIIAILAAILFPVFVQARERRGRAHVSAISSRSASLCFSTTRISTIVLAALGSGCSVAGDTSGYKPPAKLTKAQVDDQIAAIKANPKMPEHVRR